MESLSGVPEIPVDTAPLWSDCFGLKGVRAHVDQVAMATHRFLERVDVVGNVCQLGFSGLVDLLLDPLLLQPADEWLGYGVVQTACFAAHAGYQVNGLADPTPVIAAGLGALIGMDNGVSGSSAFHCCNARLQGEMSCGIAYGTERVVREWVALQSIGYEAVGIPHSPPVSDLKPAQTVLEAPESP